MVEMLDLTPAVRPRACARCSTELPAHALACPACSALVHRERLQELAERATSAAASGDRATARALWEEARALVPAASEQHQLIGERLAALADETPASSPAQRQSHEPDVVDAAAWRRRRPWACSWSAS